MHGDAPSYDSGWQDIAPANTLVLAHNLNWDPAMMLVRGECRDSPPGGLGIHQEYAGGNYVYSDGGWQGAALENLTATSVSVHRNAQDSVCNQARVRIFVRTLQLFLPMILRH